MACLVVVGDVVGKANDRYGRWTVVMASAGPNKGPLRDFEMRHNLLTPQYTTCWADLPVAKAKA